VLGGNGEGWESGTEKGGRKREVKAPMDSPRIGGAGLYGAGEKANGRRKQATSGTLEGGCRGPDGREGAMGPYHSDYRKLEKKRVKLSVTSSKREGEPAFGS